MRTVYSRINTPSIHDQKAQCPNIFLTIFLQAQRLHHQEAIFIVNANDGPTNIAELVLMFMKKLMVTADIRRADSRKDAKAVTVIGKLETAWQLASMFMSTLVSAACLFCAQLIFLGLKECYDKL